MEKGCGRYGKEKVGAGWEQDKREVEGGGGWDKVGLGRERVTEGG